MLMPMILVVDDSSTIRQLVMTALQPMGAELREASDGLEALEQLALQRFNLMTLDLNMPGMDGFEVLAFVRGHSVFKDMPIIVISTRQDGEVRARIRAAGVQRTITKPFSAADLLEAAQQTLRDAA